MTAGTRLTGLDQLRGWAALMVLGYHLWTEFGVISPFARSYLAVDFFFMLSGYVMARTYETALSDGKLSSIKFLTLRFKRLWGPVTAGTFIGLWLYIWIGQSAVAGAALLPAVLLLPNLALEKPYLLNRPAWSIFFELFANVSHALIFRKLATSALVTVAVASAVILAIYCWNMGGVFVGFRSSDFLAGVPRVLLAYCLGIVLFRRKVSALPRYSRFATPLLIVSLILLPPGTIWDILFIAIICPLIIGLAVGGKSSKAGVLLGALSFPLYAVHFPILQFSEYAELGPIAAGAAAVLGALLIGVVVDQRLANLIIIRRKQRVTRDVG